MLTAVTGIQNLSANGLVAKSRFVETKMTGNLTFPTPTPTIPTVTAARLAYEASIAAATDGGKSAHLDKRTKAAILVALLVRLAAYVTDVAGGDEAKILSAGFDVRRKRTPIGLLPAPLGLVAQISDMSGLAELHWLPEKNAIMYFIYMNDSDPKDPKGWRQVGFSSRAKDEVEGLESGKTYFFRVTAVGTAGESAPSDPAQTIVR